MPLTIDFLRDLIEEATVAFAYDPIGEEGWGMLRTLPAMKYLDTNRFTFPKSWRQLSSWSQYDYLNYDYELLYDIESTDTNLCSITDQNYEDYTEFTLQPIIAEYESSSNSGTFIVIGDRPNFEPQGGQRPLREQPFVENLGPYKKIYKKFEQAYEDVGLRCPLRDTENLFIQDNAIIYEMVTGERLRQTQELFEVLPETPFLPLYACMASIFSREEEPGSSPLDSYEEIQGLGRWLRRRIAWNRKRGLKVARRLNKAVAEDERVFDTVQPQRQLRSYEAHETVQDVSNKSEIHQRYANWMGELAT